MIVYLYGPDAYRRQREVKSIIGKYEKKHSGLTIQYFFISDEAAAEGEAQRLKDFFTVQSLFSIGGKKLGVCLVESVPESSAVAKTLKGFVSDESATIIISSQKKLPAAYKFLLDKPTIAIEFDQLSDSELNAFIKKEAERHGTALWPNSIAGLIRRYGSDTWGIVTQLQTMSLGGTLEDATDAPADFFTLINRLQAGDMAALTWLLETDEPAKVFNMVASFVKKASAKQKMADYDVAIKSGKLDYPEALLDLVLSS